MTSSSAVRAGLGEGSLAGRTAIVTGAASGIGAATTRMFVELGADVVALDRDPAALATGETHERRHPVEFDLADLDGIAALLEGIAAAHGTPTIVINAAGITGKKIATTSRAEWERVLTVDLTAPFLLIKAVGALMAEHGQGGAIVNVGSSSAYRAVDSGAAYGAAKAGLASLTRTAAWEFGPHRVTANLVAPGLTRTGIIEEAFGGLENMAAAVKSGPLSNLLSRVSEPEDVAAVIAFLCLPAARQVTGQVLHVSAGAIVAAG